MGISISTRQAYSEIDEFLGLLKEEEINKVPQKLREFFKEEKDKEYVKDINKEMPIKEQNLKEETLAIIALLNLQYWCEDEQKKERLKKVYAQNEKVYQEMLQVAFNSEDIFKTRTSTIENEKERKDNTQIAGYKEPIIKRIVNKILEFFHLK